MTVPYNRKRIDVMVGLPGSGKSTFIRNIMSMHATDDPFVYSTDTYIDQAASKLGLTYDKVFADLIKEASDHMDRGLSAALTSGIPVIWDQTNMSLKKRRSILGRIPRGWYKSCTCIVPPVSPTDEQELARRLAGRPGKTIPAGVLYSMRTSYVRPSIDEGFDEVMCYDLYGKLLSVQRR